MEMDVAHTSKDVDENHRLLEEIMNSNITNPTHNNNTSSQNKSGNLVSFLTDSSFLNIESYPQLNSKNIISSNQNQNQNLDNSKKDGILSGNIEDVHEFLKFDINTLHNNGSNSNNNNNNNHENIYPNHISPAHQHERLLYQKQMSDINNSNNNNNNIGANHLTYGNEHVASFLDDMFMTSHLNNNANMNINGVKSVDMSSLKDSTMIPSQSLSKDYLHNTNNGFNSLHNIINNPPFSTSIPNDTLSSSFQQPHSLNDPSMNIDFLFNKQHINGIDDNVLQYTDDITSSLSSSITSDIMTPSSYSFNPQPFEPLNDNNSSILSTSLKSPISSTTTPGSLRNNTYLSQSLRQPTFMGTTPKSRHSSINNNTNGNNTLDKLSTSVPKSLSHLTTEEKLRRKRDFHNAVERRRRELIKQKIKELGNLVPPSLLCFDAKGKQIKPNKGIILSKTVDYINFLLNVLEAQDKRKSQLLTKIDELERMVGEISIDGNGDTKKNKNMVNIDNLELELGDINVPSKLNNNQNSNDIVHDKIRIKMEANNPLISDDLKQFLSGDIAENEDNAKLMFNHNENKDPTEYLLQLDS